jgi:hypothetical protein
MTSPTRKRRREMSLKVERLRKEAERKARRQERAKLPNPETPPDVGANERERVKT